jgi:hypothetical protein
MIRSIAAMVERRWAMASTVLPSITRPALLDAGLDFGVQGRGRLVQHQDRRVFQEGAGKGDALALTARKLDPTFAKIGVVTLAALMVEHVGDEFMRFGGAGGGDDLGLGRLGAAVGDVVARAAVEHRGFLRDHADLAAQAFLRDLRRSMAVDQ